MKSFDPQVLIEAIKSLALFGWSVYEPSGAPDIDFLRNKTVENGYALERCPQRRRRGTRCSTRMATE